MHLPQPLRKPSEERDEVAEEYAKQAYRLGHGGLGDEEVGPDSGAVEAKWITPQDPVLVTANEGRLPAVPLQEAIKLNKLKDKVDGQAPGTRKPLSGDLRAANDGTVHGIRPRASKSSAAEGDDASLRDSVPLASTNPLFPPLPMYGPPTLARKLHCLTFRFSAAFLSFCFLMAIVLGSAFTSIPLGAKHVWIRLKGRNPDARRPFFEEEETRKKQRRDEEANWVREHSTGDVEGNPDYDEKAFISLEGGPDPLVSDLRYYARRAGLDAEEYKVQTEDGFYIQLWHLYNPRSYTPASADRRAAKDPVVFPDETLGHARDESVAAMGSRDGQRKYPVLMIHGLLQSAGAYCCTDDKSLAFYLAKSGYDVWLGNNRCGFVPEHNLLTYDDPRMWAWNIRQMGVMDLPAFISRVLEETGFEKLGLICHSQGTTQTLVALAKEQRPDIGEKISVFCALAPAAYAGPLIKKMYFKFMQVITPGMFRLLFGIHSFIPFMMTMHELLPGKLYGALGYRVFSFLFDWTDDRWEQDLRDRLFQFSPVYVSSESMRWWLGRECFARQKCILSTRSEGQLEDEEDEEEDQHAKNDNNSSKPLEQTCRCMGHVHKDHGRYAWYDARAPPMAFWVAGSDKLVDGKRLLRRFERNREPHVDVVHTKVIEEYEHLDVIWALDSIEQVGSEVRNVLWKVVPQETRAVCRTPLGCEDVDIWTRPDRRKDCESVEVIE